MDIEFIINKSSEIDQNNKVKTFQQLEEVLHIKRLEDDILTEFCYVTHNNMVGYSCHPNIWNIVTNFFIYAHTECMKEYPFKIIFENKIYQLAALTPNNCPDETHMFNNSKPVSKKEYKI